MGIHLMIHFFLNTSLIHLSHFIGVNVLRKLWKVFSLDLTPRFKSKFSSCFAWVIKGAQLQFFFIFFLLSNLNILRVQKMNGGLEGSLMTFNFWVN